MRRKTTPKTRRTSLPLWSPYDLDLEDSWELLQAPLFEARLTECQTRRESNTIRDSREQLQLELHA